MPRGLLPASRALTIASWSVSEASGRKEPPRDSDHDGIPDTWERANGLKHNDPADGALITIELEGYEECDDADQVDAGDRSNSWTEPSAERPHRRAKRRRPATGR